MVAKIVILFDDKDTEVRDKAIETLTKLGKPALPGIHLALGDPSEGVRLGAANTLGEMGSEAKDNKTILLLQTHARSDLSDKVKQACLKSLGKVQGR